jgi:hypothetical protein
LLDIVGLGSAQDYESASVQNPSDGLSVGRKVLADGTEQDTDNNSNDFQLDESTPGEQNIPYVSSVTPTPDPENPTDPVTPVDPTIPVIPKNILINEIQIQGADAYQDFIELYNPNNTDVYLNGYRLVKRAESSTADTTIKSWANDSVSKIQSKQYYLWASSTNTNYSNSINADVSTRQNISSNNGIALRYGAENSGQIIDAVGWGNFDNVLFETTAAGNPPAWQSLQRKWDLVLDAPQDTNNNLSDFGLGSPTPKLVNAIQLVVSVDKTALESAINSALSLLAAHHVGAEIGDVPQSDYNNYNSAINSARIVDSDSNAIQGDITTAISNLNTATVAFNSAIITSTVTQADKDAAKAVSDQITALPHVPSEISPSVLDNGKIADYLLPYFGYNTISGGCNDRYVCANYIYDGLWNGNTMGMNNVSPYPYMLHEWGPFLNLSASYLLPLPYHSLQIYIMEPFKNYSNCLTPTTCSEFMSHVMYVLSFHHDGDDINTGWSSTPLVVSNPLAVEDNQKISIVSAAYDALTQVQRDLVTGYYILKNDLYQISALTRATNAVDIAETAKTQESIDAANILMAKIEDGPSKTLLQNRIDAVQVSLGIISSQSIDQPAESIDQEASSSSQ